MDEYLKKLYDRFKSRDRRTLSRIISMVEDENPKVVPLLKVLHRDMNHGHRIGITGPPGAGKSTLVNSLAQEFRKKDKSVGIIAVDPTSPFTGGALLGDRIRMSPALTDRKIFMRSMASRGSTGGLARTTQQAADVLDAFGFDVIIIETVGVGQLELDVATAVDSTVVVLVPEAGGNVQAMKAGLIEIAEIFVVNKADREGAEMQKMDIEESLSLRGETDENGWKIPIILTVAMHDTGVDKLAESLSEHHDYLERQDLLERKRLNQRRQKIISIMKHRIQNSLWHNEELQPFLDALSRLCYQGRTDPFTAASEFLNRAKVAETPVDEAFLYR